MDSLIVLANVLLLLSALPTILLALETRGGTALHWLVAERTADP